ncbi:uncharacterized protein [Miscanthus floridulus]|uniref:uncharacterized protein isoform X2 n=1 Tax=Miscanthus floridulus TaxID=154761 RepID=UPI00345A7982
MDIAHDGPGTIEFSQHTTNQMVRTYATILYNVAGDAYHKKIGTETTLSFLGALRGLGAICHILVQDTVTKLKDGHLKNKITHHMDTYSQEFYKKVNNLEDEVARITEQKLQQIVTTMLQYGLDHATVYIFQLIEGRKLALKYLTSKE